VLEAGRHDHITPILDVHYSTGTGSGNWVTRSRPLTRSVTWFYLTLFSVNVKTNAPYSLYDMISYSHIYSFIHSFIQISMISFISLLFSSTSVCTGQHRRISPMSSCTRLISRPWDDFDRLPHCPSYTAVHRQWSGLPCCCCPYLEQSAPTCHVHPLCLFSDVASKLSSSGIHSNDFYRDFCSAFAVTVVIFGHLNRSVYLLTY